MVASGCALRRFAKFSLLQAAERAHEHGACSWATLAPCREGCAWKESSVAKTAAESIALDAVAVIKHLICRTEDRSIYASGL